MFLLNRRISVSNIAVMKMKNDTLRDSVMFVLNPCSIQMLSWGARTVKLTDGPVVEFPMLMRRKTCTQIYKI